MINWPGLGSGRTRQFLCILRKNLSSFPWYKCARWIFFPPNFVKHYQTSQAPSSCFGAGQIFVKCENRIDFTICMACSKEKVFKCAHDYQIKNLAETNFVEIFGRAKQILSVQCVRTLSGLNLMRIPLKFADSLNLKRVGKQLFSRDTRLSLAKRPEKPLVKTRPNECAFSFKKTLQIQQVQSGSDGACSWSNLKQRSGFRRKNPSSLKPRSFRFYFSSTRNGK